MCPQISSLNKKTKNRAQNPPPIPQAPTQTIKPPSLRKKKLTRVIIYPLLFVFVFTIRILFCEIFYIPTSSMEPTLLPNDKVLAAKKAYGYSRYSLTPFPSTAYWFKQSDNRILYNKPERGDIVAFLSTNEKKYLIKRVIGLPGDTIIDAGDHIILNGVNLPRQLIASYILKHPIDAGGVELDTASKYIEQLPNGVSYEILQIFKNQITDDTKAYRVPENHIFVIGDNRDNSDDSRKNIGFVPIENIVGRVYIKIYSKDNGMQFNVIN